MSPLEPTILGNSLTVYWLRSYSGVILLVAFLVNLATGFVQFGFSITLPSMERSLHLSHTEAGSLITISAAIRIGSALASGTLAPRLRQPSIIAVGTLVVGISMVLLGYAQDFGTAVGAGVLMGIGGGAALTPMMGLLSAWFRMNDRGLAAGMAASGGSISFIIAGVLVPVLIAANMDDGWRHSWQLFGIMVLVAGVASLFFVRERPREPLEADRQRGPARSAWPVDAFKSSAVWLIALIAFTSGWAQNLFTTFFGLYLTVEKGVSLETFGQLFNPHRYTEHRQRRALGWMSDKLGAWTSLRILVRGAGRILCPAGHRAGVCVLPDSLHPDGSDAQSDLHDMRRFGGRLRTGAVFGGGLCNNVDGRRVRQYHFPGIGGLVADYVAMKWVFWMASGGRW